MQKAEPLHTIPAAENSKMESTADQFFNPVVNTQVNAHSNQNSIPMLQNQRRKPFKRRVRKT